MVLVISIGHQYHLEHHLQYWVPQYERDVKVCERFGEEQQS